MAVRFICLCCVCSCLFLVGLAQAEPVWRNLGPGGGGWIQSICASPHDSAELFVGCDVGGFYRSGDGGDSYKIHNNGLQDYWVECIVPHPQKPDIIYSHLHEGAFVGGAGKISFDLWQGTAGT